MNKRFLRTTKDSFDSISDKSTYNDCIVFIEDLNCIWTNGNYYGLLGEHTHELYVTVELLNDLLSSMNIGQKELITSTESQMILSPNIYYRNTSTNLTSLSITFNTNGVNDTILNEYFVEFTTSSSGTTLSFPSSVKWENGEVPEFESSSTYQVSIVNNLGVVVKFK